MTDLPLQPIELRELVGAADDHFWDNPEGKILFPEIPVENYDSVFDFGCGCGRLARQLIQQTPRPSRYVGIDIHSGVIAWCKRNLTPHAPGFEFHHHDLAAVARTDRRTAPILPFPVGDQSASLVIAWSVFTHVNQEQTEFYLSEARRILRPDGILMATTFLFDKREFPMMQSFQNALFINDNDPTNAVIFDRNWMLQIAEEKGLTLTQAYPPTIRGFQWRLHFVPSKPGLTHIELPEDLAPLGSSPPPLRPLDAEKLGHE